MTLYSIRILWIACYAVVSYALPTTHDNAVLHLKNMQYLKDSSDYEKAIKEVLKTVVTDKFPDVAVKGHQHPLLRDPFDEDHTFIYTFLSDEEEVENTSPPFVKENVKDILSASDTSKDEDVENTPTSDNVYVENTPPPSVNSNVEDILPDFDNEDVQNTSPSEDGDVGTAPLSDNDEQTSLSDNEDVENTSPYEDGHVGNIPSSDNKDDEKTSLSDNEDVENTSPSEDGDVGDTPPSDNEDDEQILLSDNEDVENTSPSEDGDVGNTSPSDNEDDEQTSLSDNEDVKNTSSHSNEDVGSTDLCADATIDTITRTKSGSTYVFKGDFYWKVLPNGIAENYPRKISDDWDGLEGNLDASLTWHNGKTFFFKGNKYWRFTDKKMDPHYPNLISVGFEGIPDDLDAAFVWSGNGKTYFFKADKYWRFDLDADPPARKGYPVSISAWGKVLADGVDAAFQWENGRTYIFKGDKYYRYNDGGDKIDVGYPLSTPEEWFNCRNQKQNTTAQAQDMGEFINEYRQHLNAYRH